MTNEPKAKQPETIACEVLRDYWGEPNADGSENRVRAGDIVHLSAAEAIDAIEAGAAKRVK